jgi:hypothetical protein
MLLTEFGVSENSVSQNLTLYNVGNGAALTISSITSTNGYLSFTNVPSTIYSGANAPITITPYTLPFAGTYTDTIVIASNSNNGTVTIPVTITVAAASDIQAYTTPGSYSFTVPPGVYFLNALVVGSGGKGGAPGASYTEQVEITTGYETENYYEAITYDDYVNLEFGPIGYEGQYNVFTRYIPIYKTENEFVVGSGGGGGGSGGVVQQTNISVTPGQIISVYVDSAGNGGSSSFGTVVATSGANGGVAGVVSAGVGGAGGSPNGISGNYGAAGTGGGGGNNNATVTLNGAVYGPYGVGDSGGPDYVGSSSSGAVILWWGMLPSGNNAFTNLV